MHGWGWCSSPDAAAYKLPDYCHDLNAMFVAEKMFPNDTKESEYALELLKLVSRWAKPGFDWGDQCQNDFYRVAHATARQRALAFMAVSRSQPRFKPRPPRALITTPAAAGGLAKLRT